MSKNQIVDLNKFEPIDEMGDYDCLKLILQDAKDGSKIPPMFFIKKNRKYLVKTPNEKPWHSNLKIDRYGTKEEYTALVDWWFEEMMNDEEYKAELNNSVKNATDKGYNLKGDVEKLRVWLLNAQVSRRKCDIRGYLNTCITKNVLSWLKYHK